jgi:uncharacterized protein with ATP-grasp and redox domains
MRIYLDCIPCFFRQALEAARISGTSEKTQRIILHKVAKILPKFSLASTPPEMAQSIYKIVREMTHRKDPYKTIKTKSNKFALKLYTDLKRKVTVADDKLLKAVELAIAGNIIDYGVKNSLNLEKELKKILNKEKTFKKRKSAFFDYLHFKRALNQAKTILYLADNAGEAVFDRILIEEIKRIDRNKEAIYAVKERPIINDALIEDACECGIDKIAKVISCGSEAPGTILSLCSKDFLKVYRKADMIISKGQGNFEVLSEEKRPIFYLFMAKCPVVANDVRCKVGDIILLYSLRKDRTHFLNKSLNKH